MPYFLMALLSMALLSMALLSMALLPEISCDDLTLELLVHQRYNYVDFRKCNNHLFVSPQ